MGRHYDQLHAEERGTIMAMVAAGWGPRAIAEVLGRSPSTVSRELRRNGFRTAEERGVMGRPTLARGYDAVRAGHRARRLRYKARRRRKLHREGELWYCVRQLLWFGFSPEQIAATLGCVSHETIYTAIYAMPRGDFRRSLTVLLRRHRAARRPRSRGVDGRGRLPDLLSIHVRPPEANERLLPGHWEGDLIIGTGAATGSRKRSAVGTLVDRHSLFVMLAKMDGSTAQAALEGFGTAFGPLPPELKKTLTYDQGKEMALHAKLAESTGLTIYFADPHSPWQRGINENTNGLLRQYLPKTADLSAFSQRDLDQIAFRLNNRPRKTLGWKTPTQVFFNKCFDRSTTSDTVALGT